MFVTYPAQRSTIGETMPYIPPSFAPHTVAVNCREGKEYRFVLFVKRQDPANAEKNLAVYTFLDGRIFFGAIIVFRLSSIMSFRLINMRAGDRGLAMQAVKRYGPPASLTLTAESYWT